MQIQSHNDKTPPVHQENQMVEGTFKDAMRLEKSHIDRHLQSYKISIYTRYTIAVWVVSFRHR